MGVEGLRGLDMGCGTGVLAIVAMKCGAERMVAVDIDDWACDSCRDSMALSGVELDVRCGSMAAVEGETFDFVLANINRNILIDMMPSFAKALSAGGRLVMSGFLGEDVPHIESAAAEPGFVVESVRERDGWMVVMCKKE
jgi:ribosomal protein L11 methyltransferase